VRAVNTVENLSASGPLVRVESTLALVSFYYEVGDRPTWESLTSTQYQDLGHKAVTFVLSVGQRAGTSRNESEVIEPRKQSKWEG